MIGLLIRDVAEPHERCASSANRSHAEPDVGLVRNTSRSTHKPPRRPERRIEAAALGHRGNHKAEQEPLAHWPVAQPPEVRDVLNKLRQLAPHLDTREERSLAELDRLEIDSDPVRKREARRTHLRQIAERTAPIEQEAIHSELATLSRDLRAARRSRTLNEAFDRYGSSSIDDARATRTATLAHDTLTNQPSWMIDEIRNLHEKGQLNPRDVTDVATRITQAAVHHDRHDTLPEQWIDLSPIGPEAPVASLEVG